MGLAGTAAKLLASLDLDTRPFEAGARRAGVALGKMESRFGKIGSIAKRGVGNLATNLTKIGVVAAGAIAVAVKSGIQSLADLERVQNATAGVIESTGGKAGVTAVQIRAMAEALEKVTTADDKVIQGGQNLLLTFTGIGKEVFPQATKSMVDLGIAMAQGDVANADFKASAIQIGKALNDPIKGITALRKVGVSFTDQQQKQIKKMVESGDVMGAQKIILRELEVEFGKAGEAAGKGFGGDLRRLDDAFEDSRMALATGFLPVIRKVADKLSTELVKPEVQQQIMDFGNTLAGAFDRLLSIGGKLPWQQIGDSLKIAGQGAKAVFDAFAGLPPWIQTAVLTGWGLNKLSGGMFTDLFSVGLKGAFGQIFARGASPANPMWVQSVMGKLGGPTPPGVVPTGGGGVFGTLFKVLGVTMLAEIASQISGPLQQMGRDIGTQIPFLLKERMEAAKFLENLEWPLGPKNAPEWAGGEAPPLKNIGQVTKTGGISPDERQEHNDTQARLLKLDDRLQAVRDRARDIKSATEATSRNEIAAQRTGDRDVIAALGRIKSVVNLSVNVSQTAQVRVYQTGGTVNRTGSGSGPGGPIDPRLLY